VEFASQQDPEAEVREDEDTARLVTAFQAGDVEAFATIYSRYFDRVYGYLRAILNDRHEAEDATQQVFTQIFEALPRYERRRQPFRAWLFVAVRNLALYRLRKLNRTQVTDPVEIDRARERGQAVSDDEGLNALNWVSDADLLVFVERLPLVQRQVLVLRFLLDMPSQEIAEVLGRSSSDVRMLQSRALRFLRARLAAVGRRPIADLPERDPSQARTYLRQAPVLRARRFTLTRKR
jgi:RNA polymerase sigma-70 factor (ECF subfamily)